MICDQLSSSSSSSSLVDHPTELIVIWMSTYKEKRHSRVICYIIIQPVRDPDFDVASAEVEMEVEVAGVELNTKEVASLRIIMMMRMMLIFVMIMMMIMMMMMMMMMMEVTSLGTICQISVNKKLYLCLYCQTSWFHTFTEIVLYL